ncbi:MAG: nickel-dependent lactate racemase [Anaerolineales bacterium]|nr:nickel-dependent lactate racemase [Anaerolineales bacterium]
MLAQTFHLPYGRAHLTFRLPDSIQTDLAVSQPAVPQTDPAAAIRQALAAPIGSPPLADLARPGQRVCIAFTDITRACPDQLLVPALLAELEKAGVSDTDITLLCAVGMHRPSTRQEKIAKLGAAVVDRYRVSDHEPQNPDALVDLGATRSGVPILLNRAAIEADLLLSTGIVEPHQYAGYSGGRKTVAIGAAGEALIAHTHGPAFLDHPATRLGQIAGNPFHAAISEAARRAGLAFILNVILDDERRLLRVAAGEPESAFLDLVAFARSVYEVPIDRQYDLAIGGVGYPKDTNLYQASRAPSYLFFAPTPVVRPGGFFIIPARCQEGAGAGVGEQRFLQAMRAAVDVPSILSDARRNGYPPGGQRAFVLAKVLEQNQVIIVASEHPDLVSDCKMIPAATPDEALAIAVEALGPDLRALVVPHALLTLPVLRG